MSKTAVVLGSTGLIGSCLVEELARAQEFSKIVALSRRPLYLGLDKTINEVIDFERLPDFQTAFAADVLFSCLGTTVAAAGSIRAQRVVDVDYQLEVARLAFKQGVRHYILVSSSGANSTSLSPYLRMKGELEDEVKRIGFEFVSIIQPSLLLGNRPESRLGEKLAAKILPTLCKLPGLTRYRPIHGREVAQRMVTVAANPKQSFEVLALEDVFVH